MNHLEQLRPVLDSYLKEGKDLFEIKHIPLTPGMIKQCEQFAGLWDVTVQEAASFLLFAYLQDLEQRRDYVLNKVMPKN